ncbi:MAG: hypothetical protein AAF216_13435 [Pseudomonadota bacterium]
MGAVKVIVTHSSGQPAQGVRVSGSVVNGGMCREVRMGRHGRAVLEWPSSGSLETCFVNGSSVRGGRWRSGDTISARI